MPTLYEVTTNLTKRFDAIGGKDGVADQGERGVRPSGYTRLYLDADNHSKHDGDGEIIYKACPIVFKRDDKPDDDGKFHIRGWGSTNDLDLDDEIIEPQAFATSLASFLKRGTMLWMHDWFSKPVGKWLAAEIREGGLYMTDGILADTQDGMDIKELIGIDAINTLSVGFRVKSDEYDYEKNIRTITDLELLEVSIVTIPANPNAIFEQAKTLGLKSFTRSTNDHNGRKGIMPGISSELFKKVEALTAGFDPADGSLATRFGDVNSTLAAMQKTIIEVRDMGLKAVDPKSIVTDADFKEYCSKRETEGEALMEEIKQLQINAKEKQRPKYAVKDWRALLKDKNWVHDMNGVALPTVYQNAYKLLNLPIDFDATEDGWLIKAARNLNDCVLMVDAYYRGGGNVGKYMQQGGMHSLDVFKTLQEVLAKFDPELGKAMEIKAMATDNTGYGAEWVPTLMSGEMETLFRLRPTLVNFLRPVWQMPSPIAEWPIQTGVATAYIASQASTDNPTTLKKTKFGTGKVTFTTKTIAAAIPVSREMVEDSIVDLIPVVREELVTALMEGDEDAIINGDTTATHFDTTDGLVSTDDDVRVAWKGLRRIATDRSNTWDTQSTTAGEGDAATTFTALDVRYLRQLLGVHGLDPSQCLHVTSIKAYYYALSFSQVTKANEFGFTSTWLSGKLPALDGVEIYISSKMREDLNASGVATGSAATHTGWLTLNRRSFMPGEKRGVTIEFEFNIDVQQYLFVASHRRDFQVLSPTTQDPVAFGYNID